MAEKDVAGGGGDADTGPEAADQKHDSSTRPAAGSTLPPNIREVTELRIALLGNGYVPLPQEYRACFLSDWPDLNITVPVIEGWRWGNKSRHWLSTGLRTTETPAVDSDVDDAELAPVILATIRELAPPGRIIARYGQRPKFAVLFTTATPFAYKQLHFKSRHGVRHAIEVKANRHTITAYGIHHKTGDMYAWEGGDPRTVARSELPTIDGGWIRPLFDGLKDALAAAGCVDFDESGANRTRTRANSGAIDIDGLPIDERFKNLIRGIPDTENAHYGAGSAGESAAVLAVVGAMWREGVPETTIRAIMLDRDLPISEHIYEQSDPNKYLDRKIEEAGRDPVVEEVNASYAVITFGGKTGIMWFKEGGAFEIMDVGSFKLRDLPNKVRIGERHMQRADYWLRNRSRRQYDGLVFAPNKDVPGHYNFWQGFSVEPKAGDCSLFLDHVLTNICRGDAGLCRWVVGWAAQIFQQPDIKMGTSLVLRGEQGVGKSMFGRIIGSLLGWHYLSVASPRYVTGTFNDHMVRLLLLVADEAFWAGDKKAEGVIKDLITGDYHLIEYKYKLAIPVANHIRLLVCGNQDWLVPAGLRERRFAVLDVGEQRLQDTKYFARIDEQMNKGGREALLHHFLNFDLKTVDLRKVPQTDALRDQKMHALGPEDAWWLDVLNSGALPGCKDRGCLSRLLIEDYVEHAKRQATRRRSTETQLGMFLRKRVPGFRKRRIDRMGWYDFPPLAECRQAFAKAMGQAIDLTWDDQNEWEEKKF
jgi:hypothetical protein